jgi:hypothetical protein
MTVTVVDVETGIETQNNSPLKGVQVSIQPNPASGKVSMQYDIEEYKPGNTAMMMYNSNGKIVYQAAISNEKGKMTWDVTAWPAGMYFYAVRSGQNIIASGKMIVR